MNRSITILSMAIMLSIPFVSGADSSDEKVVEIMLASKLDETRGYCLDIAGGKGANAPVEKGLQAHTCYHYTGSILEDQGFDPLLISEGRFRISYFDVCMSVASVAEGSTISLDTCSDSDTQKFSLQENGQLVPAKNSRLCITVSATEKKEGRGASPVHVMRPISLQPCDTTKKEYQTWIVNGL